MDEKKGLNGAEQGTESEKKELNGTEQKPAQQKKEKKKRNRRKKRSGLNIVVMLVCLAAAGFGGFRYYQNKQQETAAAAVTEIQTAKAAKMDISSELSASSSLSPKNTYEVTALVEGEVLEALFEEGDVVEKDQILYVIDASSMDSDLSTAETSLLRAQEKAVTAKEEYNEAINSISGNIYKSSATGYIRTLYVREGDKVGNGTKLADIYDDSMMKLTVPFLSMEAEQIAVGSEAVVTLEDTGEQLPGVVTIVSSLEEVLSGGRLVKAVTVEVQNPGGLTTLTQATVSIGEFVCGGEGTFVPKTEFTMTADLSGNSSLEIESLMIAEGSHVADGAPIFMVTAESAEEYIKNFEDSVESAADNVESAENRLSNTQDTIENYTIKAPISGTVITKNAKVGDKIAKSSAGSSTLAVIYDLSAMTLEMSVDELDVRNVKVGQEVSITADAIEGETFSGTVTNVSLQSSYSSGVTNYPVTITMTETGELLPGMNVDAQIILDKSEDALCIPVGALMRGNRVYVREDSATAKAVMGDSGTAGEAGSEGEMPQMPEGMNPSAGTEMSQPAEGSDKSKGKNSGSGMPDRNSMQQAGVPEGFVAVRVETGIINDDYVEILSGLSEGDEVYIDPSAGSATMRMFPMSGMGGMGGMGGGMPGGNMGGGMPGSGMGGRPSGGMGGRP